MIFELGALHFPFAWGPANAVVGLHGSHTAGLSISPFSHWRQRFHSFIHSHNHAAPGYQAWCWEFILGAYIPKCVCVAGEDSQYTSKQITIKTSGSDKML